MFWTTEVPQAGEAGAGAQPDRLFTTSAPLQAHWTFYIRLALVVVSTWVALGNMLLTLRASRPPRLISPGFKLF